MFHQNGKLILYRQNYLCQLLKGSGLPHVAAMAIFKVETISDIVRQQALALVKTKLPGDISFCSLLLCTGCGKTKEARALVRASGQNLDNYKIN